MLSQMGNCMFEKAGSGKKKKRSESVVEPVMPGAAVAVSLGHHFEWAPAPTADEPQSQAWQPVELEDWILG